MAPEHPQVSLDDIADTARIAWTRLRDELEAALGQDLVALWAHGGSVAAGRSSHLGDLDTYVIVKRKPDEQAVQRIEAAQAAIARDIGIEWDSWYVLADDARRAESPRHAFREQRRDTSWAIHRAHWLAGLYVRLSGAEPAEIVPRPTGQELAVDLSRELEHIERHVVEGDTDPYEATYAVLNGSRILHAIQTGNVAISKRAAGPWALEHLATRWHPLLLAAGRAYGTDATLADAQLLASGMAPFVAMVRERLPAIAARDSEPQPRWSGY